MHYTNNKLLAEYDEVCDMDVTGLNDANHDAVLYLKEQLKNEILKRMDSAHAPRHF